MEMCMDQRSQGSARTHFLEIKLSDRTVAILMAEWQHGYGRWQSGSMDAAKEAKVASGRRDDGRCVCAGECF